jgi:hypothetical protein
MIESSSEIKDVFREEFMSQTHANNSSLLSWGFLFSGSGKEAMKSTRK